MLLALFRSVSNHFNFFHTIWHYFIVPSCYFIVFHYFSMFVSTFLHGLDGIQAASAASAAVASAAVAVDDGKVDVSTCRVVAAGRMVGSTMDLSIEMTKIFSLPMGAVLVDLCRGKVDPNLMVGILHDQNCEVSKWHHHFESELLGG